MLSSALRLLFPSLGAIAGAAIVAVPAMLLAGKAGQWLGEREGRAAAAAACRESELAAELAELKRQRAAAAIVATERARRAAALDAAQSLRGAAIDALIRDAEGDGGACRASDDDVRRLRDVWGGIGDGPHPGRH